MEGKIRVKEAERSQGTTSKLRCGVELIEVGLEPRLPEARSELEHICQEVQLATPAEVCVEECFEQWCVGYVFLTRASSIDRHQSTQKVQCGHPTARERMRGGRRSRVCARAAAAAAAAERARFPDRPSHLNLSNTGLCRMALSRQHTIARQCHLCVRLMWITMAAQAERTRAVRSRASPTIASILP